MPAAVKVSNGNKYVRMSKPHIAKSCGIFKVSGVGYSSDLLPDYRDNFLRAVFHCDKLNRAARALERT